jgi:hypothetical protein
MAWDDRADAGAVHEMIRLFLETVYVHRGGGLEADAERTGQTIEFIAAGVLLNVLDERGFIAHPAPSEPVLKDTPYGLADFTLPSIPANLIEPIKAIVRVASDANEALLWTHADALRSLPAESPVRQSLGLSQVILERWRDHLGMEVEDLLDSVDA